MPEELLARLQSLEDEVHGDKERARQEQFFSTYGDRFSNNRGLGMAILNELDARGVDTSAADEAVQQILDQLRVECNEIIESIKSVQQEAIENARKVEEVSNAVNDATAKNPEASVDASDNDVAAALADLGANPDMGPSPDMPAEQPPMDTGASPDMSPSPDMGPNPDMGPSPDMPPAEQPPMDMPPEPAPAEQPPMDDTVSDNRMKRIKGVLSDVRMKRIKANSYKPSAGILEAATRGY